MLKNWEDFKKMETCMALCTEDGRVVAMVRVLCGRLWVDNIQAPKANWGAGDWASNVTLWTPVSSEVKQSNSHSHCWERIMRWWSEFYINNYLDSPLCSPEMIIYCFALTFLNISFGQILGTSWFCHICEWGIYFFYVIAGLEKGDWTRHTDKGSDMSELF